MDKVDISEVLEASPCVGQALKVNSEDIIEGSVDGADKLEILETVACMGTIHGIYNSPWKRA